jgi:hypothetical protein
LKIASTFFVLTTACLPLLAQQADSLSIARKDSVALADLNNFFTHEDSLEIFVLIDSLLSMDVPKSKSMMGVRLGYNSNILADNRTFNIDQFGLAPGVSYYHKSGAYADLSAYWSKEYDPHFYLTVGSVGYLNSFGKHYNLLAEYSHYFYNQPGDSTVYIPYVNNVGVTNYFDFKPLVLRLDYYFYFGDRTAHRIMPGIGLNLIKKKWLGLDRVSVYPAFNVLFGTDDATKYELYPNLAARIIYNRLNPSNRLPLIRKENYTVFGVMNYAFTIPVTVTKGNWSFLLGYTYNIPKSLQDEDTSLENSGYVSFSITRYIDF